MNIWEDLKTWLAFLLSFIKHVEDDDGAGMGHQGGHSDMNTQIWEDLKTWLAFHISFQKYLEDEEGRGESFF